MRQIVNGKVYDTDKSVCIASDRYWDGHSFSRKGKNIYLFKTPKGNFFLYRTTQWQGEMNYIEPISKEEAKEWYEELPIHEVDYEIAFGESPEEA